MLMRKKAGKELSRREIIARRQLEAATQDSADGRTTTGRHTWLKNRTIAGDAVSDRQSWRALRAKRRRLAGVLMGVLVVVGVLMFILMQLVVMVRVSTPAPIDKVYTDTYTDILDKYFAERPIERLRFLLQKDTLQAFFAAQAPEVKTVTVAGSSQLAHADLRLTFRQPVAQWSSGGRTYFVDESGVTFERNHFDPPGVIVKDESNIQAELGVEVINQRSLAFLGRVVSGFREHGFEVEEVVLPENTLRTVNIRLRERITVVQMTIDRDAKAQVDEAAKALAYLDARGDSPGTLVVSVDQRVFYK